MSGIRRGDSLTSQVRDYLLDRIMEDTFDQDVIYSVSDLAAQLEVSRTPVREAVLQLQELGLLRTVKNKGFTVIAVTDGDILEAFQMRHVLEPIGAKLAARTAPDSPSIAEKLEHYFAQMVEASKQQDQAAFIENDIRFHDVMMEAAGNSHMFRALKAARDSTYRRGVFTRTPTRSWDALNLEHERILRAVVEGDEAAAEHHMRDHIQITGENYLKRLKFPVEREWYRDY